MIFEGLTTVEQMISGAIVGIALMDGIMMWYCVLKIWAIQRYLHLDISD